MLHEFEDYTSCQAVLNYAEASTLNITVAAGSTAAPYLIDGFYVSIDDNYFIIRDRKETSDQVYITAYSAFFMLRQRVANEETVEGTVDSISKTLITNNTQGERSLPITCAEAQTDGTSHTWTTEKQKVDSEITEILKLDESGIKTEFNGSGFVFDTYHGTDRSAENTEGNEPVIFAVKYDNLLSYSHETGNTDTVNVVYVEDDEGNLTEYNPENASGIDRYEATASKSAESTGETPPDDGEPDVPPPENTSRLPEGYTEVEYIESDGQAYINTKVTAKSGVKVKCKYMPITANLETSIFLGAAPSSWSPRFYLISHEEGKHAYGYGNHILTNVDAVLNQIREIEVELSAGSQRVILDGVTIATGNNTTNINLGLDLYMFCGNAAGKAHNPYKYRVYGDQEMYVNGTIERQYIPCVTVDGEAGFYDLVTSEFYGNAGEGAFIAGPAVETTVSTYSQRATTNTKQENNASSALVKPKDAITATVAPYTYVYGADYFVGDIVTIEHKSTKAMLVDGEYDTMEVTRRHAVRVESIKIDYSTDAASYTPTFGTSVRDLRTVIKKQQRDVRSNKTAIQAATRRIAALEAANETT